MHSWDKGFCPVDYYWEVILRKNSGGKEWANIKEENLVQRCVTKLVHTVGNKDSVLKG